MNNKELKEVIEYSKNLDVLFIEDNDEVREQISKLLHNFFPKLVCAIDGEEAYKIYKNFKKINNKNFDLVVSDLNLPKVDGINLCKKILKNNPKQLILVISAHTESDKLLNLIEIGIFKFLQKPVDYKNFITTILKTIDKIKSDYEINLNIQKIQNKNDELNILIKTDKLTKVKNRAFIDDYLEQKINFSNKDLYMCIVMIDLDDFKIVNDTYGHLVGDEILKEFSTLISNSIRKEDIIARWGGEEFLMIFNDCTLSEGSNKTEKIRKIIENNIFTHQIKLTASFGLAILEIDDNVKSLIQRADMNLYKSKTLGKNRIT